MSANYMSQHVARYIILNQNSHQATPDSMQAPLQLPMRLSEDLRMCCSRSTVRAQPAGDHKMLCWCCSPSFVLKSMETAGLTGQKGAPCCLPVASLPSPARQFCTCTATSWKPSDKGMLLNWIQHAHVQLHHGSLPTRVCFSTGFRTHMYSFSTRVCFCLTCGMHVFVLAGLHPAVYQHQEA